MARYRDILTFWFGPYRQFLDISFVNRNMWFAKNTDLDALIKSKFGKDVTKAGNGEYDSWLTEAPPQSLALLILLDQFPRNMYRDRKEAFEYDSKASHVALKLMENEWVKRMPTPGKLFVTVALGHAENMEMQRKALQLVREMRQNATQDEKNIILDNEKYAKMHADIIERFGRFPHRNAVLGRESTKEEIEFLRTFPGF